MWLSALWSTRYPVKGLTNLLEEYDYIIAGGGTAGCVLANRLSADTSATVLVIEQGPLADSWASKVPLFSSDFASDGSRTLKQESEYQPELGRNLLLYTGKVVGGSTRINQMLYTRGLAGEYDAWKAAGRKGWGWDDLKPYFKKSERAIYPCDPDVHGTKGEWHNTTADDFHFPGFYKAIEACQDIGLPYVDDINSPSHPAFGCGRLHFTRDDNARRNSSYHAFLPKSLVTARAGNLHICVDTVAHRVGFEHTPEGVPVARSLHVSDKEGGSYIVKARKEIILSSGPFGSPQLLMLSGIGPSDHLKEHGITIIRDLPAVGSNLEDHFGVSMAYRVPMNHSLLVLQRRPWIFLLEFFRYLLFGTGMLLAPVLQLAIFTSSRFLDQRGEPSKSEKATSQDLPDLEIMPMAYDSSDQSFDTSQGVFSFLNVLLRPESKGTVHLTAPDIRAPLAIDPRFLTSPSDITRLRGALRLSLRIVERMRAHGYPITYWPGQSPENEDDATLEKFIRRRNRTTYHYSSTCRMAPEDDPNGGGVVDDCLRVHGVQGLRVADSSIFPNVPGTHLQAPTVAVAEKCADMILNDC